MKSWTYVAVTLVVPQLWAVVFVRGMAAWARSQERAARRRAGDVPRDYTI